MMDGDGYEYATLPCRWSTVDAVSTTVNLKMAFCGDSVDDQPTLLRLSAVINTLATTSNLVSGMYEGTVNRNQAVMESQSLCNNSDIGDNELVRIWLQGARAALIGQIFTNDDDSVPKDSIEYVYYLKLLNSEGSQVSTQQQLLLLWKKKLRPFGMVTLGTIQLSLVEESVRQNMSSQFIEPLICCLLEERRRHEQANHLADKRAEQLSEDNRRLLDQLRLVAESRQKDDQRLMAQFLKVLNTKKQRLAAMKQELSELKQQRQCNMTAAVDKIEVEKATTSKRNQRLSLVGRGRGRGHSRGGLRKPEFKPIVDEERLDNNEVVVKKKRPSTTQYGSNVTCSNSSEDKKQRSDMDMNALLQQYNENQLQQKIEPLEMNNIVSSIPADNVVVDVKATTMSPLPPENIFEADTLIDDITPDGSPPWLQQQVPVEPITSVSSSTLPNQSPNKDSSHQQTKKHSVLEDLWAGIL